MKRLLVFSICFLISIHNISQVNIDEINKIDYKSEFSKNRFSISPGFGISYAGLGLRAQYRRASKLDLGIDLFAGWAGNSSPGMGLGLKWYFAKNFYLNTLYYKRGKNFYGDNNYSLGFLSGVDLIKYLDKKAFGLNIGLGLQQVQTYNYYIQYNSSTHHMDVINYEQMLNWSFIFDLGFIWILGF